MKILSINEFVPCWNCIRSSWIPILEKCNCRSPALVSHSSLRIVISVIICELYSYLHLADLIKSLSNWKITYQLCFSSQELNNYSSAFAVYWYEMSKFATLPRCRTLFLEFLFCLAYSLFILSSAFLNHPSASVSKQLSRLVPCITLSRNLPRYC
jgi:hypothetical protein